MVKSAIYEELKNHTPFTIFGAVTGIVLMALFYKIPENIAYNVFYVLHPLHIVFSALVTASIYEIHKCGWRCGHERGKCNLWMLLIVGYVGSIGIATLSDSVIPYLGELILGMPKTELHLGFIEEWWLINPLAILGVALAYFRPSTKVPHSMHVLLSTWASLFHIIMALGGRLTWPQALVSFLFIFVAVWIPCCISDIIFPLLFVGKDKAAHSH